MTASDTMFHLQAPDAREVPLLVSIPHTGEELAPGLSERMASDTVRALPDTDFHLHRLYDFVPKLGARLLYARFSRYVIDLNRPEDQAPLYPGRSETGLVPTSSFAGEPLYRPGEVPSTSEIDECKLEARDHPEWALEFYPKAEAQIREMRAMSDA